MEIICKIKATEAGKGRQYESESKKKAEYI